MAILTFDARAVQACITHARASKTFIAKWDGPVNVPKLLICVGHGVHIMSNGADTPTLQLHDAQNPTGQFHYAEGLDPFSCDDWMENRRRAFRDLTGLYHTNILDDAQTLIDRGADKLRISTDGHSMRVFAQTQSDYLIGGRYDVPSGLGRTFSVELLDINDMIATVKNVGNQNGFDAMQPYRVPLDDLREIETRRAA